MPSSPSNIPLPYPAVIAKPWGQEEILAKNDFYVVKRLTMRQGHQCSYQYHQHKLETVYVLSGQLTIIGEAGARHYPPGSVVTIQPHENHRMAAADGDCVYLECSTPQLDDVVRLVDDYGRK